MNLGQMRLEVRRAIDELTASFWTDAEINDWLNEGAKIMVSISQTLQSVHQFSTEQGKQEYLLPADLDEIFGVTLSMGGSLTQLRPTYAENVQWGNATSGVPNQFYTRSQTGESVSQDDNGLTVSKVAEGPRTLIGFFPIPSSAYQITINYFARHGTMRNDLMCPLIPVEYHRGIINFAIAQAKVKDEAYSEANRFLEQFKEYSDRLRDKSIARGQGMEFPSVTLTDEYELPKGEIVIRYGSASYGS